MTTTYAVAAYFSPEARRAAVSETYSPPKGYARGYARTAHGCCPVGVMLRADGHGERYRCPDSSLAASAIADGLEPIQGRAAGMERFRAIRTATAAFIAAWDEGAIDDLAAALDCPAKPGRLLGKSPAGRAIDRKTMRNTTGPETTKRGA